ncbi:unnamed protein product [Nippostrongylus brasiliensis]|uniref:MAM domain-containing protein n=1 Tax=Nippostrongylus brasiliensis TaxID=27835 RepID=A0A0N4XTI6_NIPBR|nr:unnamed protein product [Nippostrongylus brasiliensis]
MYDYSHRMGPYRSEAQHHSALSNDHDHSHHAPGFQVAYDEPRLNSVSMLSCGTFAEKCKWANTNDEEMDWITLQALPNPERYLAALGILYHKNAIMNRSFLVADPAAAALVSAARPGWEGGQLISDPLPCLPYGIRVTATAWRTRSGPIHDQPKLQVCSKNVNEVKFPLVNCNDFDVRNGVPVTVDVPAANNPNQPAQIVFYGNNFVSSQGGAIFLQDIVVEGSLTCDGESLDSHPVLVGENPSQREFDERQPQLSSAYSKNSERADPIGPLKVMDGLSSLEMLVDRSSNTIKATRKSMISSSNAKPPKPFDEQSIVEAPIPLPPSPFSTLTAPSVPSPFASMPVQSALFESCLELSCNPSGLSLSICTDKMECFYRKRTLLTGDGIDENKKWNVRCVSLPAGTYELRVVAENFGENKGEIGFLPIRLARDPAGQQMIC